MTEKNIVKYAFGQKYEQILRLQPDAMEFGENVK